MADKKISELGTAAAVYDADDFALVQDGDTKQVNASAVKAYIGDAPTIVGGTVDGATIGSDTASTGAFTTLSSSSTTTLNGTTIPASKTLLVTTDIGTTSGTVAAGDHTHTGVYEPADATILKDADIGSSIQAYDADLSAIAALSGTSGLLKKTAADTWALDTSAYSTTVGTVTSVSGAGTVNGLTLTGTVTSSGSLTLGGTLDLSSPPAIGGTTPAAGAFTTLSSTGNTTLGDASADTLTINGTAVSAPNGLNVNSNQLVLSSGNVGIGTNSPATKLHIVGTTAATGLSIGNIVGGTAAVLGVTTASDFLTYVNGSERLRIDSSGSLLLRQSSNAANTSVSFNTTVQNALTLDASGNLGLGVTPSAWNTSWKALQLGSGAAISGRADNATISYIHANSFRNTSGSWAYTTTGVATLYAQDTGGHYWYTAPSGTAGNPIAFTQAMTLTSKGLLVGYTSDSSLSGTGNAIFSGSVGIGTSSPSATLDVVGFVEATSGFNTKFENANATTNIPATPQSGGYSLTKIPNRASTTNASFIEFSGVYAGDNNRSSSWIGAVYNNDYSSNLYFYSGKKTNASIANYDSALSAIFSQDLVRFYTGSAGASSTTERLRIDSSGNTTPGADNTQDFGSSTKRWNDIYVGGGVYLGGTGAANYLDDYEEGTWTPVLRFGTASTGITYQDQKGNYTKVGNLVRIYGKIMLTNKGSLTGTATIAGVPFTANVSDPGLPVTVLVSDLTGVGSQIQAFISGDVITFQVVNSGTESGLISSFFKNTSDLYVSVTYRI